MIVQHAIKAFTGLALGFVLARIGFTDYGELHKMLTLQDIRMILVFGGAVGVAGAGFFAWRKGRHMPTRKIHKGSIFGGLLFGTGWALTGVCPAIPMIQLGQGDMTALLTMSGIVAGIVAWPRLNGFLRWDTGSCG